MRWESGCTYPEISMVGVLGCGESDDVRIESWGSALEVGGQTPGTPSNSSTAAVLFLFILFEQFFRSFKNYYKLII